MRMPIGRTAACAGALTTALLAAAPLPEAAYVDGPPPAHSGGFGGDTCHACHFENDLDAPGGSLTISGVPDAFDPSATYRITVSLARRGMERSGFQLAARVGAGERAGEPAGALSALDGDRRVQVVPGPDVVTYAQHAEPGTDAHRPRYKFLDRRMAPARHERSIGRLPRSGQRGERRRLRVRRLHLPRHR